MELDKILENVESRLVRVGHALWKTDRKADLRLEADQVADELQQRHAALENAAADRSDLQRLIKQNQNAIEVMTGHVQACLTYGHGDQAWQFALQLDGLRQQVATDQARLPKLEQVCWSLQFQIRQMERQLARLQQQIQSA
jgi:hypothetical protein